ncbi:hypothetical protein G3N95_21750 [Paraburkholderia sp. Tr-20389]|uniref:hypothetical protein n=1 Tax=Paraburkholderia sp. Tr-20389 TaxID=2703903 RepID=UPI001981436B|nr:hypothetical protein [Paraburkholderia sp. Tr-20389]MBN3755582.1 hypothetical protein [Paraburkholderia sp. Tr-20389]
MESPLAERERATQLMNPVTTVLLDLAKKPHPLISGFATTRPDAFDVFVVRFGPADTRPPVTRRPTCLNGARIACRAVALDLFAILRRYGDTREAQ